MITSAIAVRARVVIEWLRWLGWQLDEALERAAIAIHMNTARLRFERYQRERALRRRRYYNPGSDPQPRNPLKDQKPRAFTRRSSSSADSLERIKEARETRAEKNARRARRAGARREDNQSER